LTAALGGDRQFRLTRHEHRIQHRKGEEALKPEEWFGLKRIRYLRR
jgi:hypothetical protein